MNDIVEETGTGRRTRRTTTEIRTLILKAARAVFAERGFSGATTRRIAAQAGVAEPLIFSNFGNKADLFAAAVIEPFNTRFMEFLASSEEGMGSREDRNAHFVHTLYPFLRDHADLLHALVKSAGDLETAQLHDLDGYFSSAVQRMRERYAEAGWKFDLPPELLVRYSFGLLAGVVLFREWFFPDEGGPDEKTAEQTLARMIFKATEPDA